MLKSILAGLLGLIAGNHAIGANPLDLPPAPRRPGGGVRLRRRPFEPTPGAFGDRQRAARKYPKHVPAGAEGAQPTQLCPGKHAQRLAKAAAMFGAFNPEVKP